MKSRRGGEEAGKQEAAASKRSKNAECWEVQSEFGELLYLLAHLHETRPERKKAKWQVSASLNHGGYDATGLGLIFQPMVVLVANMKRLCMHRIQHDRKLWIGLVMQTLTNASAPCEPVNVLDRHNTIWEKILSTWTYRLPPCLSAIEGQIVGTTARLVGRIRHTVRGGRLVDVKAGSSTQARVCIAPSISRVSYATFKQYRAIAPAQFSPGRKRRCARVPCESAKTMVSEVHLYGHHTTGTSGLIVLDVSGQDPLVSRPPIFITTFEAFFLLRLRSLLFQFNNMKSFTALVLFASVALAAPSLELRQTNNANKPTCGVAGDATLSDCQHLYDNWPYYQDATWGATCHSGITLEYNPTCYGNCCIYTSSRTPLWEDVHTAVGQLLGCRSEEKGTVNGRVQVTDSGTVCMADRKACGDCFN